MANLPKEARRGRALARLLKEEKRLGHKVYQKQMETLVKRIPNISFSELDYEPEKLIQTLENRYGPAGGDK